MADDPLAWDEAVAELRHYALADREHIAVLDRMPGTADERTEPALRLHRLTQQVARDRLGAAADDAAAFQRVLSAACRSEAQLSENWPRLGALEPHVAQLDQLLLNGGSEVRDLAWLLDRAGTWLWDCPALYSAARSRFEHALALCRMAFGDEDAATLAHRNNLAFTTLWAQGDLLGARGLQETVLAVRRRVLGKEHPDTLTSMNNLAETLRTQGDLPGARGLQETVLAVRRRVLGVEHPDTLASMNNLAITLWHAGERAAAIDAMQSAVSGFARALGADHLRARQVTESLASMLAATGAQPAVSTAPAPPSTPAPGLATTLRRLLGRWFARDTQQ